MFTLEKKKGARFQTHSLHPPPTKNAKKKVVTFTYVSLAKKLNRQKKMHFAKSSSPRHCKCTWKTHSASSPRFKRTDGNPHRRRVLPIVFFWLLVRRRCLEFPTHPPRCMYTILLYIFAPTNCWFFYRTVVGRIFGSK